MTMQFEGGNGFSRREGNIRATNAELEFLGQVSGLTPVEEIEWPETDSA